MNIKRDAEELFFCTWLAGIDIIFVLDKILTKSTLSSMFINVIDVVRHYVHLIYLEETPGP